MKSFVNLLILLLFVSDICVAQTSDVSPVTAAEPAPGQDSSEVLIRTKSGELIPLADLLGNGVVEEILQRAQEQRIIPRYTISQMEVVGSIDRDKVQLSVELKIEVNPKDEWVTVPVSFGDVYVEDFESHSEAVNGQALLTTREQNTRQWHLKGKGLHTVSMQLVGKTRTISPGLSQINLNLPLATASHSVLSFASPVEIQKLPTGAVDKATRDDLGVKHVEFWGLPSAFSLTWSDVVTRVAQKPVIQVQNRMKLDLTTIPVTLTGTQVLQISGSPISEIRVTFPEGFQLVEAEARNAAGVSVLNNFESPPAAGSVPAIIRLTSAIEGTLTLSYDLELTNRQFPQDIKVSIPSILDVNQQPGDLEILFPTGLLVQQKDLKGAQRIRVPSESDLGVAATAFRMRSPESQIVLHVEETEAQFAVSPELTLQPDAQNVLATVRYPVNVLKGSLLDLSIVWPGYSSGDWQILPGTTRLVSGKSSLPLSMTLSETDPDLLLLTFPERQSGEFAVEFRAFAVLERVRSGAVQLRCPEVMSRRGQPFVVTTVESDAYSIRPISMGTGELLPSVPVSGSVAIAGNEAGLKSESWLQDDPTVPLRLELPDQAPSVNAVLTLGMQPRENGIEVRETIQFEIEHRELPGFSLQVPEGIRPTVRIAGKSEQMRATIESSNWSFRLPEARRGSLEIEVAYFWPAPLEAAQTTEFIYQLPVILPQSSDIQSIQAGTSSLSGLRVADETKWSPVYSERFESAVETTLPVVSVPLKWSDRHSETSSTSPDLILARTRIIGNQAITSTLAVYDSVPEFIFVETPEDLTVEAIVMGGGSLTSGTADPAIMRSQRIADRNLIRWTISARNVPGIPGGPVILEFRVREKLPEKSRLWITTFFRRAIVAGESPAIPVVWCVGSQDEYQAVSASLMFSSLTLRAATILPGGDSARTLADRQIQAVLSPYARPLQLMVTDRTEDWFNQPGRQDLFYGSADSGALKIYLVPNVSLLLVSALTCVAFFLLMSVFRQITVVVPVLIFIIFGLIAWLLFPERTLMLAPYAGMGVVFGVVSVSFQRLTSDRGSRLTRSPQSNDFPTVFGFSGVISPSHVASENSAAGPASFPAEVSVGSARS